MTMSAQPRWLSIHRVQYGVGTATAVREQVRFSLNDGRPEASPTPLRADRAEDDDLRLILGQFPAVKRRQPIAASSDGRPHSAQLDVAALLGVGPESTPRS